MFPRYDEALVKYLYLKHMIKVVPDKFVRPNIQQALPSKTLTYIEPANPNQRIMSKSPSKVQACVELEKPLLNRMSKSPSKQFQTISYDFKDIPAQAVSNNHALTKSEVKKSSVPQKSSIGSKLFSEAPKLKSSAFERLNEKSIFKSLLKQATTSIPDEPIPAISNSFVKSKSPMKIQKESISTQYQKGTYGLYPELMRQKKPVLSKSPTQSLPKLQATAPVAPSRSPTPGKVNGKISVIKGPQLTLPDFNTDSFNVFTIDDTLSVTYL